MIACALVAAVCLTGSARAADGTRLKLQLDLMDPATRRSESVPVFAEADRIVGQTEEEVELQGHAQLRKTGNVIHADLIRYTQLEDEVFAVGNVRIVRDGDVFTGPELRLKLDIRSGYFLEPTYERGAGPGRGHAQRIDFLGPERTQLTQSIYTTCAPDNLEWYVSTSSLTIDEAARSGSGTNAVVYFKGVPILASPWITFPLDNERKSGFLPPTFSLTSRSGAEFMLPYYFNFAPNRDLTLYPKYIGTRGIQAGAAFRYLEPTYKGDARIEYLPSDKQTGQDRYSLAAVHSLGTGPWNASWNVNKVSDDNYFVDFSRTIAVASQRTLPRDALLSYTGNNGYWTAATHVLRYQTLQDPLNPITRPYEKLPQVTLHGERRDLRGFDFVADLDATRFSHPTQVDGTRVIVNPSVSYPYIAPGYFITPKIALHSTQYNLTNTVGPTQFMRSLPIASIDAGLIFERDAMVLGKALRQTLEPRLFYVRTPYIDQSLYPNFDSGLPALSFAQLFTENQFGGSDRIADANQLTAAVVSRYLDAETGAERARFAIGQRFYLSPQRVTLPGTTAIDQKSSDFIAAAAAELVPHVSAEAAMQYSQTVDAVVRSTAGVRWQPERGKVVNAAYRYLRDSLNQTDFSAQWPLGGSWYGVGRVNYSMRDKRVIESLGGLEYNGCCWILRVVAQRFVTATASSTTSLFVQLELKGFSRIGVNPMDALRRNIPGYQDVNPPTPAPSPFRNYE